MDKLNRDIHYFYFKNSHDMKSHAGGKRRDNEVIYKGHKIYYNVSPNIYGDINTILISGGRDAGRRPCFHMTIKDSIASLQTLERGADCFIDRHNNTKEMVELAFQIAIQKGCSKFELIDNSYISCKNGRFHLADLYFLTKGHTWYESILPINIIGMDDSEMAEYRRRAKTITWKKVADYLVTKGTILDFIDITDININSLGSSMVVLGRIKNMKNQDSCRFFSENTGHILFISTLPSFHGSLWNFNSKRTYNRLQ
jgi:hypothetical protein